MVDEFSEELEIVDLDNLEDGELDELDELNLEGFGEIDLSCDKPHFAFATSELRNYLKVARHITNAEGRDIVSKSISVTPEDGRLVFRSTDFDVYFEYYVDLLNEENVLEDNVIFPMDIILKLIKAAPVNTVIFKDDEGYKMRLAGGDIPVETYNVDVNKFLYNGELDKNTDISSTDLYDVINGCGDIVSSAVSPMERRIICEEKEAFASFMWISLKMEASFAEMDLKIKDIKVLKNLLGDVDEDIEVYTSVSDKVERKVLKGNKFKYAFLVSTISISQSVKDELNKVLLDNGIYVDYNSLSKMVTLAAELPYSIGKVGVNYTKDGSLKLVIKTKSEKDSEFTINGSVAGDIKPLKKDLVLQANLFKILLKSFSDSSSIKLSLSDNGVGLYTDKFKAAIYPESS